MRTLFKFILFVCICISGIGMSEPPPCFQDLELNFFKYEIVTQAFSMHRIGQSQWTTLMSGLQSRSREVPALMQAQASRMNPNPLGYPFQPLIAKNALKQVLFLVFRQVMLENHITEVTNQIAVQQMFEHIWSSQRSRMVSCLGTEAFSDEIIRD